MSLLLVLAVSVVMMFESGSCANQITVGSVEGKTYYMINPGVRLNWWEAETQCCRTGGTLGTIESQAQYTTLNGQKTAINSLCSSQMWWTAGRDARYKAFEWNNNNATVVSFSGKPIRRSDQSLSYCLAGTFTAGFAELEQDSCSYNAQYCVLCQK